MRAIDLIKISKDLLKSLSEIGVKTSDFRFIGMYNEYKELLDDGLKKEYIKSHLSNKYKVSESTIFRVISRLDKHIKI